MGWSETHSKHTRIRAWKLQGSNNPASCSGESNNPWHEDKKGNIMEVEARGMGTTEVLNESAETGILFEREARKMYKPGTK